MGPGDYTKERARRFGLLASLKALDLTLKAIPASVVRELGVYGRYPGTHTELTSSDDGSESTRTAVSMLQAGRHYADDFSAQSLTYHYPHTGQPGLDRSDIDACKWPSFLSSLSLLCSIPQWGSRSEKSALATWSVQTTQDSNFLCTSVNSRSPRPCNRMTLALQLPSKSSERSGERQTSAPVMKRGLRSTSRNATEKNLRFAISELLRC